MDSVEYVLGVFQKDVEFHLKEYPVAFPLAGFTFLAFIVLVICRLRTTSPKAITEEIRREIKSKVDHVKDFVGVGTRPRFRKRDKIYFYGRKMLRKVKANIPIRPVPSRQLARRIARQFLGRHEKDGPQLVVVEPPAEYLQEDFLHADSSVPSEFLIMLRNLRVFGHFDMPLFLELCKSLHTVFLYKGQTLFQIGEVDENIYIIQTGKVSVYVTEQDGIKYELKEVSSGESIISLLSFCDVLTGHTKTYRTVSAKAMEDSTVMKFPVKAFEKMFQNHPDMFVRIIQIIMVRLMRVTFLALHQYLGLSSELMSKLPRRNSQGTVVPSLGSPMKVKRESGSSAGDADTMDDEVPPVMGSFPQEKDKPEVPERDKKAHNRRIVLVAPKDDDDSILKLATEKFRNLFQLDSEDILKGAVKVRDVSAGSFLMKQDSVQDTALVYILTGSLIVSQHPPDGPGDVHMFTAQPGDVVGGLAVLSGDPSFFSVRARHRSKVATITKDTFFAIMKQNPRVVLHIASTVMRRLSPFVRQIDFALDWEHVESGRALYRQGQKADSTYIVLSGRLRSVITNPSGHKEVVGEYGKGDLVGIVELLTQTERGTTVMAVRDSELAKLPAGLFNVIKLKYPIVMTRLIKLLGQRILGTWKSNSNTALGIAIDHRPIQSNFSTVAIVPTSEDIPLSQFTLDLHHSLLGIGPAVRLTADYVVKSLGTSIWEAANEYQLTSWLGQIEDQNRMTLYQCDTSLTVWTQRCIRQADVILTVGLAEGESTVGKIEKYVESTAIRTQKILVLLHREDGPKPAGTVKWLNMRSWCQSHHHIRAPKRIFMKKSHAKIIEYYMEKVFPTPPNIHSDFSRLARVLTGTSVGLVLGGGGARGAAHVGMMKALQEFGVPVDMVGGVSIGAFIGAVYCLEGDLTRVTQKVREWSKKMTSKWRMVIDLTYPIVSMFTGAGFNRLVHEAVGNTNIEDLWLPYFTLTTDITDSCARIHTHGSTWRYVRASMSLSGYMPPICDPVDGHLLVDGGYVNNLPADIMKKNWSVGSILAIDVGSQYNSQFTNYGDSLSGWNILIRTTFPFKYFFRKEIKVPNLYDIQSRLSYVSCIRQLEDLKANNICEYIRPPIDKFQTLQFGAFDEIREIGYQHGKSYFSGMLKSGKTVEQIYCLRADASSERCQQVNRKLNLISSPASFTDLAEIVCSVKRPQAYQAGLDVSSSELEDEGGGYASEPNTNSLFYEVMHSEISKFRRKRTGSLSDDMIDNLSQETEESQEEEVPAPPDREAVGEG